MDPLELEDPLIWRFLMRTRLSQDPKTRSSFWSFRGGRRLEARADEEVLFFSFDTRSRVGRGCHDFVASAIKNGGTKEKGAPDGRQVCLLHRKTSQGVLTP